MYSEAYDAPYSMSLFCFYVDQWNQDYGSDGDNYEHIDRMAEVDSDDGMYIDYEYVALGRLFLLYVGDVPIYHLKSSMKVGDTFFWNCL